MQKQYDEYLKKQQIMTSQNDILDSTHSSNLRMKLAPSSAQENIDRNYGLTLPAPKLSDKNYRNQYNEYPDQDESDESSDDYDSEGIDSIKMRIGSYDAVN